MKHTILILYRATEYWLQLSREERGEFFEKELAPIMVKYQQALTIRLFDSEAFHAKTSDFMIVECTDLEQYYFFIEEIRDTKLFSEPYIELTDVIMGIENGFKQFEESSEK
ncbi:hypothetical protein QQ008_16850 [Fulvivirgaceae bacterium BMA10]|uniref:Darcynin 1 n=1 Tax=Splendidivirga corallicola TaxID=3051826 RepID=A0ABT8KQR3_9BACT|nr:hypothetical protein [Fulvivirgaceae bacterium BMA10]